MSDSPQSGLKVRGEMRCLSKEWFFKEMPNGKKILRKWMIYSPNSKQLYCFCCRLFASSDETESLFVSGFFKWWKLNPKVVQHENSEEHLGNLEKWKLFETGLKLENTIDSELLKNMVSEKKKWRNILTRLLDITLFLSKQNLAFRGHDESENSTNRGNFLEMVKLLSKYDAVLKEHTMRLDRHASYLSPETQNEFLNVLASHVRNVLIQEIKSVGYFSMMFDSTPDTSHVDQMSEVIRYVKINNGKVEIKEVFLRFLPLKGKKASDLSSEIFANLESDGLDIMMCRCQGYDHATVMSGVHGGVQAIIKSKNEKALFNGCVNHLVNLCGVHSFAENALCVSFFGTLEQIFAFFSASTHRWDVLLNHCDCSVKRLSTTRWSAHYAAVKAVEENFDKVIAAIEELCDPQENVDTRGSAQSLLPAVCNFTFLCFLYFWKEVLKEIDCTQVYLQTKALSLDKVAAKLELLRLFVHEERNNVVDKSIDRALLTAEEYGLKTERRVRFRKRMAGEQANDAGLTLQAEIRRSMI
ncbi:zinc finger MYM-type protein 1-like [Leptopilina heterotoma]|uniref:zinc finger MYM-type protein 1-like n=1 Tax=Leptopilina heterotoma TaxID=63436 RepID=UPI001CA99CD4|nr:zinc finger MYM-type protein 1-like [Leptopilina heterotoma]